MLERYINWDDVAIKMLQQHDDNQVALVNLREEYASVTDGLGATDYSKDRVENSADMDSGIIHRILHKEALEKKIRVLY